MWGDGAAAVSTTSEGRQVPLARYLPGALARQVMLARRLHGPCQGTCRPPLVVGSGPKDSSTHTLYHRHTWCGSHNTHYTATKCQWPSSKQFVQQQQQHQATPVVSTIPPKHQHQQPKFVLHLLQQQEHQATSAVPTIPPTYHIISYHINNRKVAGAI